MAGDRRIVAAKAGVWLACLLPLAWLAGDALGGRLGANPIETVLHRTGWWALALLAASLSLTPLRRLTGWNRLVRLRRLVGLFAFFYATTHFLVYVAVDQGLAWSYIAEDIGKRPFVLVGFAAWLLLLSLALTSTRGWIRRLGRNWARLHALVYIAAVLGTLHFVWKVKADTREPLVFALLFAVLLVVRLPASVRWMERRRARSRVNGGERDGGRAPKRAPPGPRSTAEAPGG